MSEFQLYDFRAIDRCLTREEREKVGNLSSRTIPSSNRAVFTYAYSDFRAEPLEVLEEFFDAMLYMANWGEKRLIFKFPAETIEAEKIHKYCTEVESSYISLHIDQKYAILDIQWCDTESDGLWIDEDDGQMDELVFLREAIIKGDYRCLYLAWLSMNLYLDEEVIEPPVPAGLRNLNSQLTEFIELCGLDDLVIKVAAEASSEEEPTNVDDNLNKFIPNLSEDEKNHYLSELLSGNTSIGIQLKRRLREFTSAPENKPKAGARTNEEILFRAEGIRAEAKKAKRLKAEKAHKKEMERLIPRQSEMWKEVASHIKEKKVKFYDLAVDILVSLKQLAIYQNQLPDFLERVNQISASHKNLPGLQCRLKDAGLLAD